jgi:tetratricopeptide (TPR) repeat protein
MTSEDEKKNSIKKIIEHSPCYTTYEFSSFARNILLDSQNEIPISLFISILNDIYKSDSEEHYIREKSFIITLHYHRRRKETSKVIDMIRYGRTFFSDQSLLNVFEASYNLSPDIQTLLSGIHSARTLFVKSQNPHFGNAFCDLILKAHSKSKEIPQWASLLDEAQTVIDKCIELNSEYAGFWSTRGKLYAALGFPELASSAIHRAVDKENPDNRDYAIRIQEYAFMMFEIRLKAALDFSKDDLEQHAGRIQSKIDSVEAKIDSSLSKNIEIISIFSASVSFIISAVILSINVDPKNSIVLIGCLSGAIMCSLSGIGLVVKRKNTYLYYVLNLFIGITIFILSSIILPQYI